ncbi:S8 family peptidase [Paenibacillus mendelii]|uniref:S8 family peptidase n=1 Tax=Paenibacillus mendelii TaxID=206163 RepID=A0ABV6JH53_9BACL|nr:S8 family peptidase [Paenibacillus mendelii]MCQ6558107.1 S8 family peptidase [Paenibacillus mendelii]
MERMLRRCQVSGISGHTIRQMIRFKYRRHYARCMRELRKYGIRPAKSIKGERIICCNIDSRQLQRFRSLMAHPHIKYVEPDFVIKAHMLPSPSRGGGLAGSRTKPGMPVTLQRSQIHNTPGGKRSGSRSPRTGKSLPLLFKRIVRRQPGGKAAAAQSCPAGVTWNVCRVQAPEVWPRTRGGSIPIAIIDTGIANHPDLYIAGGINTINGSSYRDDNGHGTHVAGIASALGTSGLIPGVAPRAKLYAVKALNANGEGFISNIVEGIDWCIRKGVRVINLSLGLQGASSTALRDAVKRARSKGIIVVSSAGNSGAGSGGIDEPASYPETLAVAASTRDNQIASFSSRGSGIDVTAPGTAIRSTSPGGGYQTMEGTSMASPHVAGGAALLLSQDPRLTPSQVAQRLRASAQRLSGYSSASQGSGLLQIADALSLRSSRVRARRTARISCRCTLSKRGKRSKQRKKR